MVSSSTTGADTESQKSTPPSSPPPADMEDANFAISKEMQEEEENIRVKREKEDEKREKKLEKERQKDLKGGKEALDTKFKGLEHLMNKSKLFATVMLAQMQRQEEDEKIRDEKTQGQARKREEKAEKAAAESQRRATRAAVTNGDQVEGKTLPTRGREKPKRGEGKSTGKISDFFKREDIEKKASKGNVAEALQEAAAEEEVKKSDIGIQNLKSARQPRLVTGGIMRSYQLEGLEWLISLYENGINGILADEMGLGKTIQTIAFLAYLREKKSYGPFMIAAPLSTTSNWVEEFRKWTPDIPVVLYHGSKADRKEIREQRLKYPGSDEFPVVVTSYEICMNDRKFLAGFGWKFIIIDEGHRIKNLDCRLIRELQSYQSTNRLLITGTPLQNNLNELWSLLHFLMPAIFDKFDSFESWFDFSALGDRKSYEELFSEERKQYLVSSLHAVLKPFLLRRVKADVENMMPRKREYILFAPLTPMQRELYQAILDGTSRDYLEEKAVERLSLGSTSGTATPRSARSTGSLKRKIHDSSADTPNKSAKSSREATPSNSLQGKRGRGRPRKNYEEISDRKFFAQMEASTSSPGDSELDSEAEEEQIRTTTLALAKRQIGAKKLQNPIMQLRLCCNSPYNFFNPFISTSTGPTPKESFTTETEPDETLVTTSGKMLLLDALLPELLKRGHKVLIFSQFTTQLDLLSTYCTALRSWPVCRIDGSVPQAERQSQIRAFNKPAPTSRKAPKGQQQREEEQACNIFLLTTRAGGQGINLAAADTVILFDSDWNPQQDLQAQDRAHRIGQTRNVIVYRFATRNTVEARLLAGAEGKRRLEKLVIRKGGVRAGGRPGKDDAAKEELEELQRLLRREDGEKFDVDAVVGGDMKLLGKRELEVLLDRSDEAYVRAEKGLDAGGEGVVFRTVEQRGDEGLMEGLKV
ncbi:ISWI chromatin-remodeling complex ATPase ISW2 [Lepidopterella palustris CBS 459.81]|uniref:ISWI chromatin-remodeling complex ATPase ISW2 n=1 Tax=Lepidopterella palustris CBS 459.81 TaxID=1314670 RepID=A0A8E2E6R0_9PEZI|nr:ISWI chromatin-remodeling complex ATPase ISW2 [Lepidopterella palustris CBS 459.81]